MQTGLLSCGPDTPLREAAERMASRRCSSMLVMEGDQVLGIWTERDSLRLDFNNPQALLTPIGQMMSTPVSQLHPNTPLSAVAARFRAEGHRHFLVVDDRGRPRGIVSQTDMALKQGLEPYLGLREVHEAMDGQPLTVAGALSLAEVAALMHQQGRDAAVVACADGGYGILTERDMVRFVARHPGNTPVGGLASRPLLTVNRGDTLLRARDQLIDHRVRHLAVLEGRQVVGLLGFRNILDGVEHRYQQQLRQALEQRDQALSRSRLNLELAERVIEASLEGIIITDAEGRIEFVNPAFSHTTGYDPEEVLGRTPAVLSSGRHDGAFYTEMWRTLREKGYWRGEIWNRRKSGQLYLELLTITAIRDGEGRITNFAALFTDITHIRENEDQIRQLAYYDPLTRLPNRRLLEDRLELAIRHAHRHQRRLAVLFIDLDHFKQVNDSLGHAAGDELLLEVSRRLGGRLREDDTLARLGGDEFIVLLPDLEEADEVTRVARRLIDAIGEPFRIGQQSFRIGCSLGISLYPDDATGAEELVHHADAAMYRAKQEGRNGYRLFRRDMNQQEHRWLQMETALRDAVESGEGLSLHYQPQVEPADRRVRAAEALARWQHPELGAVSPADFIPLAERAGLMVPLGRRLMRLAAAQLRTWLDEGRTPVPVSVNLSAQQFWQQDLVTEVSTLLADYRLPAGLLGLELTESILLDKQQQAERLLQELRELGCPLAIDDFGTGYSSLSYLHALPVTSLKIDRSFIRQLGECRSSSAVLAAVTGLARELELQVVAEGVETPAQLDALARYHVPLVQGWLTGRPMPATEFAESCLSTAARSVPTS
ncbi:EAL domain-containing protein [Zobellella sp. CGMCC 1.18722]|uniref:EAL domain-containing protein n=2 Tax=Zobellella iuensis TaxID=2803811 RepID=A0ABS1QQL0_9GAMM|nr:EAL domain-containing protein [Zobellella iuensis]MBL1377157.1 EAL domain-containing protein [Zobellella iuensis]